MGIVVSIRESKWDTTKIRLKESETSPSRLAEVNLSESELVRTPNRI